MNYGGKLKIFSLFTIRIKVNCELCWTSSKQCRFCRHIVLIKFYWKDSGWKSEPFISAWDYYTYWRKSSNTFITQIYNFHFLVQKTLQLDEPGSDHEQEEGDYQIKMDDVLMCGDRLHWISWGVHTVSNDIPLRFVYCNVLPKWWSFLPITWISKNRMYFL